MLWSTAHNQLSPRQECRKLRKNILICSSSWDLYWLRGLGLSESTHWWLKWWQSETTNQWADIEFICFFFDDFVSCKLRSSYVCILTVIIGENVCCCEQFQNSRRIIFCTRITAARYSSKLHSFDECVLSETSRVIRLTNRTKGRNREQKRSRRSCSGDTSQDHAWVETSYTMNKIEN